MATTSPETPAAAGPARRLQRKKFRLGDELFRGGLVLAILIALGALVWLTVSVLMKGLPVLDMAFLSDKASSRVSRAGFNSALKGSLVLMIITMLVAVPLGFAAATYLEKFAPLSRAELTVTARRKARTLALRRDRGELSGLRLLMGRIGVAVSAFWARVGPPIIRVVDVNIANLAAVPSIIYGLLGLAMFVSIMGVSKSLLAGGLTLAVLVLPIIIISAREAIRAVPTSIEQGAMALGASRWQAVSRQVLPAALPGMLTGTILAMSRAIGESAPLVVVGGVAFATQKISANPLNANEQPLVAMPLQIFDWVERPQQGLWGPKAAAGIIVLLVALLLMNAVAIWLRNRFTRRW